MKISRLCFLSLLCLALPGIRAEARDGYPLGPDSQTKPGVPQGTVTHSVFKTSKIFPGTERDVWVYVPKQYDSKIPAAVMVFQDGGGFQSREGQFRVPVVFDNLISSHQMPVTVAIMVNPGTVPAANANSLPRYNRSHEYDGVTDDYARFLQEELLPEVGKSLNLTKDPAGRGLCGASSGGICSFIAAWEHPEWFSKVVSFVGSFTDLQGGNTYASAIRKYEPRPIRVVLQDGSADQDIYSGVWFLGNTDVAMALKFAGYEYQFVTGTGGHNGEQGGQILPDALKFVWKDYPNQVPRPFNVRQPVMEVVKPGETWKDITPAGSTITGLTSGADGTVHIVTAAGTVHTVTADSALQESHTTVPGAGAVATLPDGGIAIAEPSHRRIVKLGKDGKLRTLATGVIASSLVAAHNGDLYVTEEKAGCVWLIKPNGKKTVVDRGLPGADGVTLTPDQTLLHVSTKAPGKYVYSYVVLPNGELGHKQAYFDIRLDYATAESYAAGMATDTQGRLYVTSNTGIQLLDQAGRVIGILENPAHTPTTALAFGGLSRDQLFTIAGGKLYTRTVRAHGVTPFTAAIKPPGPRL